MAGVAFGVKGVKGRNLRFGVPSSVMEGKGSESWSYGSRVSREKDAF